jgi:hypothetical protein
MGKRVMKENVTSVEDNLPEIMELKVKPEEGDGGWRTDHWCLNCISDGR